MRDPSRLAVEDRPTWRSLGVTLRWHERLHGFAVYDRFAFVLRDTNSDEREIELELYARNGGVWEGWAAMDDVGLSGAEGCGWACGAGTASSTVAVAYGDQTYEVTVNSAGWWGFASDAPDEHFPVRVR